MTATVEESMGKEDRWPDLPLEAWQNTYQTLHLWTQIVGKLRLIQTPWINHSWHVPLYPNPRGLTTSAFPVPRGTLEVEFDFYDHQLRLMTSWGKTARVELKPQTVAKFYGEVMDRLDGLDIEIPIYTTPAEIPDSIPFEQDEIHRSYDGESAQRLLRILLSTAEVMRTFRAEFVGKCSPIHFFWGAFDLAVTRFSGRTAPEHPGGMPNLPDWVAREAYSHEVSSAGFWPGGGPHPFPLFYSYAYPEPEGFRAARVAPVEAFFSEDLGEFVLPYDAVRASEDPESTLFRFFQSTYEAAAEYADWDRATLERTGPPGPPKR